MLLNRIEDFEQTRIATEVVLVLIEQPPELISSVSEQGSDGGERQRKPIDQGERLSRQIREGTSDMFKECKSNNNYLI